MAGRRGLPYANRATLVRLAHTRCRDDRAALIGGTRRNVELQLFDQLFDNGALLGRERYADERKALAGHGVLSCPA